MGLCFFYFFPHIQQLQLHTFFNCFIFEEVFKDQHSGWVHQHWEKPSAGSPCVKPCYHMVWGLSGTISNSLCSKAGDRCEPPVSAARPGPSSQHQPLDTAAGNKHSAKDEMVKRKKEISRIYITSWLIGCGKNKFKGYKQQAELFSLALMVHWGSFFFKCFSDLVHELSPLIAGNQTTLAKLWHRQD